MKKFFGLFLVFALLVSLFSGITVSGVEYGTKGNPLVENSKTDPIVYSGDNLKFYDDFNALYTFDSDTSTDYWDTDNGDVTTKEFISADSQSKNENAYGGVGGSMKVSITKPSAQITPAGEANKYFSYIRYKSEFTKFSKSNMNNASISFWLKTDTPIFVVARLLSDYSGNKACVTEIIKVPAGEHIVEIPLAHFIVTTDTIFDNTDYFKIIQPRFYFLRQDWTSNGANIYVDNFGYSLNQSNGTKDAKLKEKAIVSYDMENISEELKVSDMVWQNKAGNGTLSLSVDESENKLPQGSTVKWNFDADTEFPTSNWSKKDGSDYLTVTLDEAAENVYGGEGKSLKLKTTGTYSSIMSKEQINASNGEAIIAWVKSDRNTTLKAYGYANGWSNTAACSLPVKQGENILIFKFSDFAGNNVVDPVTVINQFQFVIESAGTLWIDSIGYYTEPEQKAKTNSNAYGGEGQSIHYTNSSPSTDIAGNVFFFKNSKINFQDKNGYVWGKDATLAIWIKTNRAIKIKLAGDDGYQWNSGAHRWATSEYLVPAGESVLRVPLSDFSTKYFEDKQHNEPQIWNFMGSIHFYVKSATNSGSLDIYLDQFAVECPVIGDINDDESIDLVDFVRLKKVLANVSGINALESVCDINADGEIHADDIGALRKYLIGTGEIAVTPYQAPTEVQTLTITENLGYDA